jgi:hypothetical protein
MIPAEERPQRAATEVVLMALRAETSLEMNADGVRHVIPRKQVVLEHTLMRNSS